MLNPKIIPIKRNMEYNPEQGHYKVMVELVQEIDVQESENGIENKVQYDKNGWNMHSKPGHPDYIYIAQLGAQERDQRILSLHPVS